MLDHTVLAVPLGVHMTTCYCWGGSPYVSDGWMLQSQSGWALVRNGPHEWDEHCMCHVGQALYVSTALQLRHYNRGGWLFEMVKDRATIKPQPTVGWLDAIGF